MYKVNYILTYDTPKSKEVVCEFLADYLEEAINTAFKEMATYCKNNHIKVNYWRFWTESDATTFDYGSHTSFFTLSVREDK